MAHVTFVSGVMVTDSWWGMTDDGYEALEGGKRKLLPSETSTVVGVTIEVMITSLALTPKEEVCFNSPKIVIHHVDVTMFLFGCHKRNKGTKEQKVWSLFMKQ